MKLATYLFAVVLFAGFFLLQPSSAQTNTTTTEASATTTTTTTTATPSTVHRKHFTAHNIHYKIVRRIHVNKKKSTG
ncbi:uncharacterized protein LOC110176557 [Drosophila serrata]|uniref:uncharacterized protein LOC110176557 n=1 Tax=Drosophila serrata TaxID=7274 RepID=UPI000A1D36FC|nr:uncharacterized protein LOC110176557 [Drosophila serrata]KAH8367044.1 hypothetical protein KR200_001058 [Drosophila serrata]